VKECYLDAFAEVFAAAGLAALVFDNRNFGASDGAPRQEIDPWAQVRDYRHAITFAQTLPGIDRDRIGVWGSSYSGGHALVLGAIDKRIKAVGGPGPLISGFANVQRLVRRDFIGGLRAGLDADREARFAGKEPGMIPVVAEDPLAPSALPTPTRGSGSPRRAGRGAPSWRNEVTLRSVEMLMEVRAVTYSAGQPHAAPDGGGGPATSSPRPTWPWRPTRRPGEPKKLVILPGGHFGAYTGPDFDRSSTAARDWLLEHL